MRAIDWAALAAPLPEGDLQWRVGQTYKGDRGARVSLLCYLTARGVEDRLDSVLGPDRWRRSHTQGPDGGVMCSIDVYCGPELGWVSKTDGAENTQMESVKGGLSDSFKRAARCWGVGRYLYRLESTWVPVQDMRPRDCANAVRVNDKRQGVRGWAAPPPLPSWALPSPSGHPSPQQQPASQPAPVQTPTAEPVKRDPSWPNDKGRFMAKVQGLGLGYDQLCDFLVDFYGEDTPQSTRPSRLDQEARSGLLGWLLSADGKAAAEHWLNGSESGA